MKTEYEHFGSARITKNPLTGDWFVYGQIEAGRGELPSYIQPTKSAATKLAKTVDHFNKTGMVKKF